MRCALICVTCDLPATRKLCGFTAATSFKDCSKCNNYSGFNRNDYSGFNRNDWTARTYTEHKQQVDELVNANTLTQKKEIQKKYGVRYSELSELAYFDIISFHVVDLMHNLLLGTAKHMMDLWKEL